MAENKNMRGSNKTMILFSGLRFVQEIKFISKYRDCLKILRIVICKYTVLQKCSFRAKSHFKSLVDWLVW